MTITLTREEAQQLLEVFELFLEEAEDVTTLEDNLVKMLHARLSAPEQLGEIVPADEEQLKRIAKLVELEPEPPRFPTMLRKMWSGSEVQAWIDEHYTAPPQHEVPEGYALIGIDALKAWGVYEQVFEACRYPVAKPKKEQEPVAYGVLDDDGQIDWTVEYPFSNESGWPDSVPLYTAPPQREWQGLTDDEIESEWLDALSIKGKTFIPFIHFARVIEGILKEKNHG